MINTRGGSSSSSAVVSRRISAPPPIASSRSLVVDFNSVDTILENRLLQLDTKLRLSNRLCQVSCSQPCKIHPKLALLKGKVLLNDLHREYQTLCQIGGEEQANSGLLDEELAVIEEYKLAILSSISKYLATERRLASFYEPPPPPPKIAPMWFEPERYYYTIASLLVMMALGNFLGLIGLLELIPGISKVVLWGITGLLSAAECFLHYVMLLPALKQAFPSASSSPIRSILEIQGEQLQAIKNINQQLTSHPKNNDRISFLDYCSYIEVTKFINNSFASQQVKPIEVSKWKKGLTWVLGMINGALTLSGGYFWGQTILTAMAPALLGTLIGWGVIILLVVTLLHNNHILRANNVEGTLSPDLGRHQVLARELDNFKKTVSKKDSELNYVCGNKKDQEQKRRENVVAFTNEFQSTFQFYRLSRENPSALKKVDVVRSTTALAKQRNI